MKRMLTSKIILTIAVIELCSGFLRQGILKWYRTFAGATGSVDAFVYSNWGMVSCIAGITGGIFAGLISDHVFQSRRGPVSSVLYGIMVAGCLLIFPVLAYPGAVSWIIAFMAMAIIGVHGMLSGVASQDFGGKKNAGTATGIIDGFVYLGTAMQAVTYGYLLPEKGLRRRQGLQQLVRLAGRHAADGDHRPLLRHPHLERARRQDPADSQRHPAVAPSPAFLPRASSNSLPAPSVINQPPEQAVAPALSLLILFTG